jgi:archaellum biogenesis protein FlaJ (TadC family)
MSIYYQNREVLLILSIELCNSLFSSGVSKIDILKKIGEEEFGDISKISKKIVLTSQKQNIHVENAISQEYNHISDTILKDFFSAFNVAEDVDIRPLLTNIGNQVIKERDISAEEKLSKVTGRMNKIIVVLMMPVLILLAIFIQDAISTLLTFQLRPMMDYIIYGVMALALVVLLAGLSDT